LYHKKTNKQKELFYALWVQEAEIRRLLVPSQPRQIVHKTLSQKYPTQNGWWSGSRSLRLGAEPQYSRKKNLYSSNAEICK
jgi:hypothetical protein